MNKSPDQSGSYERVCTKYALNLSKSIPVLWFLIGSWRTDLQKKNIISGSSARQRAPPHGAMRADDQHVQREDLPLLVVLVLYGQHRLGGLYVPLDAHILLAGTGEF